MASKYYYNGILLKEYCKNEGLSYSTIKSRIRKINEEGKITDSDEIVQLSVDEYKNLNIKYMYNGVTLREYCESEGINYEAITTQIRRLKKKGKITDNSEIIRLSIVEYKKLNIKYMYGGIPLVEYCKNEGINYDTIKRRIRKIKEEGKITDVDEIVRLSVDEYKDTRTKYMYEGVPLMDYCKDNNIAYQSIMGRIYRRKKKNSSLTPSELVKLSLSEYYNMNFMYFVDDIPLKEWCVKNGGGYPTALY